MAEEDGPTKMSCGWRCAQRGAARREEHTHPLVGEPDLPGLLQLLGAALAARAAGACGRRVRNHERELAARLDRREGHLVRQRHGKPVVLEHRPVQCHVVPIVCRRRDEGVEMSVEDKGRLTWRHRCIAP
jgi:hypothetical protein